MLLTLGGCGGSSQMPVVLQGDPVGIAYLAGRWEGEYWGASNGRAGTITLSLSGSRDSVYGEVRMVDPSGRSPRAADPAAQHSVHVRTAQSLAIAFVRVADGKVSGRMEPYIAPDCDCVVNTSFTGVIDGNAISGTFVMRSPKGDADQGRWKVERMGDAPR
jgi:hypothetical protein